MRRNLPDAAVPLKPDSAGLDLSRSHAHMLRMSPSRIPAMPIAAAAGHDSRRKGHGLAAVLLAAACVIGLAGTAGLALLADRPDEASGDLVAVFPPGTGETQALAAVAMSDGSIRRGGPFGPIWLVTSATPGFAGRLRRQGARLVLPGLPFAGLSLGGCSFMPYGSYDRPGVAKLRAGPM